MAAIILICGSIALGLTAIRFIRHRMAYAVTDAVFIRTDSLVNLGFDGVDGRIATMTKNEGEDGRPERPWPPSMPSVSSWR